ncbi:hypothetical protein Tco_0291954, partial [Tanacetum coccineum]
LKQALAFQNHFYLKKAQQIRTMLYDGNVIAKETNILVNVLSHNENCLMNKLYTLILTNLLLRLSKLRLLGNFLRSNPSTSASGSKPSGNTKNDRILRTPSSNEKNKVEVQSRKFKSSLNKRSSDSKNVCNEHVKNPVKGAKALCFKNKKRKEWKPAGKVFNSIGYKWKPTGRTFTLVRNACPLTRLTATKKVPLRVPNPLEVVAPKHVVTKVYTRRPKVPKSVQNSKPKVAKSMTANRMEPGTSQGSDTSVAPSSSSLIDCKLSKLFCGIWTLDALST